MIEILFQFAQSQQPSVKMECVTIAVPVDSWAGSKSRYVKVFVTGFYKVFYGK